MSALEQRDEDASAASGYARSRGERAGLAVLEGTSRHHRLFSFLPFLGPAFVASVAYMDPGNFATNISAGAQFGYKLLWVVVVSNLIAMLVQYLSAKLGIATGLNLPEAIRASWPRPVTIGLWVAAEIAAMATNLAEFFGAALGFNLLFHIALLPAAVLTALTTFAILALQRAGARPVEAAVGGLVGVIALCYLIETLIDRPDWGLVGYHSVTPYVGSNTILVSVGILGATVMPHVVYLHSALTQRRVGTNSDAEKRRLLRFTAIDVVIAMVIAGFVNMAMLYMAASTFHTRGFTSINDLRDAYHTLTPLLGGLSGTVFGISLLASGVASSAVGTMAGQVIMGGFIRRTVPVWVRWLVTMVPALVVIGLNLPSTQTLVVSQVFLSLALPFALVPLVWFTARSSTMGVLVNRRLTTVAAVACTAVVLSLNAVLLFQAVQGV